MCIRDRRKMLLIGIVISLTLIFSSFAFVVQSAAAEKDTLVGISAAHDSSEGSHWEQNHIDFTTYQQYYEYYRQSWEQNKDAFKEIGIEDMDDLMDTLFIQMFVQSSSSDAQGSDSSSSEGGNQ